MPTSLLLMASDHQNRTHDSTNEPLCGSDEYRAEPSKGRGRRSNPKGPNRKKQPQRGLGVAQLERLRLQEMKKMNETRASLLLVPIPRLPEQNQHQFLQYQTLSFTVHDPFGNVPLCYCPEALHGALLGPPRPVVNGNTVGLPQMTGNGSGFNVLGGGWLVTNQAAPYGFGAPILLSSALAGSPLETSKELSSMPNTHSVSDHCEHCKKKRCNLDNIKELNTRSHWLSDHLWPINGSDSSRFGSQQSPNLTAETCDFSTRVATYDTTNYVSRKNDECVEVVVVHRKGNVKTGKVFMEYEFFPEKNGRGNTFKELELPTVASVALAGEASPLTATTDYGDTASTSIDLSLKLSY